MGLVKHGAASGGGTTAAYLLGGNAKAIGQRRDARLGRVQERVLVRDGRLREVSTHETTMLDAKCTLRTKPRRAGRAIERRAAAIVQMCGKKKKKLHRKNKSATPETSDTNT
jgi:hypothetical protein